MNLPSKLNKILSKLLEGIDTPKIHEERADNERERLVEFIEVKNYPYALIHCPHQKEKGIGEDCVECQILQRETYQAHFKLLAVQKGLTHPHTLKAAFDYYSTLIAQYRLTECDELLDKIYSICLERGNWSTFYIMAIQARAFLRFKQGKYLESLDYFNMQLEALGPNERIYENMALAYSRLANYQQASICYAQAILLIQQKPLDQQEFSTLLLGLSTVLDNMDDALIVLEESMKLLQAKYDKPHSLMAKALSAMGDLYIKKNDIIAATTCYEKAVRIFIDTCGYETPLTANSLNKQAKSLLLLDRKIDAINTYIAALKVWVKVDSESFEASAVVEALLMLMQEYQKTTALGKAPDDTIVILELLQDKIKDNPILRNDINTICLLKFIAELYILNKDIPRAIICCRLFKNCLSELDSVSLGEYEPYRRKLLAESILLLEMLEKISR